MTSDSYIASPETVKSLLSRKELVFQKKEE